MAHEVDTLGHGQTTGEEQRFQGELGVGPIPPRASRCVGMILEISGANRPPLRHLPQDRVDGAGVVLHPAIHRRPVPVPLHPVAEQGPVLDRYECGLVGPVFDHLTGAPADPLGEGHRVVPETSEEREEVRPGYDVDRVELHHADPLNDPSQVPDVDLAGWTSIGESLGGQGDSASLGDIELAHGGGRVNRTGPFPSLASRSP